MARTSVFFGSVKLKALCQKRLKLSFGFAELAYRLGSGALFLWFVSFWTNKKNRTKWARRSQMNISTSLLNASIGRFVEIVWTKRIASPAAQRSPGEMLSNKKPLSRLFFVISTSLLNASIGRSVEIICTKRIASPAAQRSRGRCYQTKSRCRG